VITERCFVFHWTVALTVRWYCGGRPNCELWPYAWSRFSGV